MRRRDLLEYLAAGALALAWPLRTAAARLERCPRDLLGRIRRRTRPLTNNELYEPHDLAG